MSEFEVRADRYFAIVPEWVLDHEGLSDRSVRVYGFLHRKAGRSGQARGGRKWLASKARCSLSSVDRAIDELEAAGAICRQRVRSEDGDFDKTLYMVHFDQCSGCVPDQGEPLPLALEPSSPVTTGSPTRDATGSPTGDEGVASPVTTDPLYRESPYREPSTTTTARGVVTSGDDDVEAVEADPPKPELPAFRLARHWAKLKGIPFQGARRSLVPQVSAAITALQADDVTVDEDLLEFAHRLGVKVPGGWWIAVAARAEKGAPVADCAVCGNRRIVVVLDDGRRVPPGHDDAGLSDVTDRCECVKEQAS